MVVLCLFTIRGSLSKDLHNNTLQDTVLHGTPYAYQGPEAVAATLLGPLCWFVWEEVKGSKWSSWFTAPLS